MVPFVRIASLVPSATELLYALGLGDSVVAVTHECDYPATAAGLPHLTRSVIPDGLAAAQIDAAVRERTGRGEPLYELDEPLLHTLAPDLVVTQALCAVCAVSFDDVRAVAERLPSRPAVMALEPASLAEVLDDCERVAVAAGAPGRGAALASAGRERIEAVRRCVEAAEAPRVAALEWLDPPFVGGHWVPEMIALAGGIDALGTPGARSRTASWAELERAAAEVVISMPCGYGAGRAAEETSEHWQRVASMGARRVVAVDASAYFSRPGPRLVDGVELLGHLLHPTLVPAPPPGRAVELSAPPVVVASGTPTTASAHLSPS